MRSITDIYLDTVIPRPWQILGLRMQRLCIGHLKALERLKVSEPRTVTELMSAVLVCSIPVEKIESELQSTWFAFQVRLWCILKRRSLAKPGEFFRQLGFFREYIADGTSGPGFLNIEEGSESSTPFCQGLRVALMSRLHYRPGEIDSTPVSQALWDLRAYDELHGRIQFVDGEAGEFQRLQQERASKFAEDVASGRFQWP